MTLYNQPRELRLAGRLVPQSMMNDKDTAKRAGRRVILVTAGPLPAANSAVADGDCPNCAGFGQLGLEVLLEGPFQSNPVNRNWHSEDGGSITSSAWHNGAWWKTVRTMYPCPVCSNVREIIL